jgi:hypothetical protein
MNSWGKENEFVDGTQEYSISSTITNIINGGGAGGTSNLITSVYEPFTYGNTTSNVFNTYVNNSNLAGEIKFYTKSNNSGKILTKIGYDGKLYFYHYYKII